MSRPSAAVRRVIAEAAVLDVPEGLSARPPQPGDVGAVTALLRATDIAGCGHTSSNLEETEAMLANPGTDWEFGSVTLWRGSEVVGVLFVDDTLRSGGGWTLDVYARPGDVKVHGIQGTLIDAALREGRYRWDALYMDPEEPMPIARSMCYANDAPLRADLEQRGFAEVRRYWRMKIDHWSVEGLTGATQDAQSQGEAGSSSGSAVRPVPDGYRIRAFRDREDEWRAIHEVDSEAFLDHFDYVPMDFAGWAARMRLDIEDPGQWLVAEHEGAIVGFVMGSNRYASEDYGYVSVIAVQQGHRGHGLARALLRARLADDVERGFLGTILHVDATNTTGATKLYESVGMSVDSEYVGFHRELFRFH